MAIAYNASIVRDGLIFYIDAANSKSYPGSGTSVIDISGSGSNGTLAGGTGFSTNNGGSLQFDGVDDTLTHVYSGLTQLNSFTGANSFTFSSTVRLNSYPTSGYETVGLLMKGSYNPSYGLNIKYTVDVGGFWTVAYFSTGLRNLTGTAGVTQGYGSVGNSSTTTLTLGQWYKVDFVHSFSGTSHTVKLYVNGVLEANDIFTNALYPINIQNSSNLGISNGQISGGNYKPSNLSIAQSMIYNRALTDSEIQQNFTAIRGRYNI